MGARAGFSTASSVRLIGATNPWKPKGSSAGAVSGGAEITGNMECGHEPRRSDLGGVFHGQLRETDWRDKPMEAERQLSRRSLWRCGNYWKYGVRARAQVITTLVTVGLCRILKRPQIIADRYHRKQDDDEHHESDQGQARLGFGSTLKAKPKNHDDHRHHCPGGIEE